MRTDEWAIIIILVASNLLLAVGLISMIMGFAPKYWESHKAQTFGFAIALLVMLHPLSLYCYNHWFDLSPSERANLRARAEESEAQACQKAGYTTEHFWEAVHDHFSSHHLCTGSLCSKFVCVDKNNLTHEIIPPECNSHRFKKCK